MFTSIQNALSAGELSPSIFARTDLQKWHSGTSTCRNFFVNYRGGASSRAGTAYVGMCKQGAPNAGGTPTNNPPRDIPFQFSLTQGFALEFGDQYMRVKSNGAYITEAPKNVVSITHANPGVIDIAAHGFSNGDWVFATGIGGMTEFNGLTWIVQNVTTNTFTLTNLFGVPVNTNAFPTYTTGGTFARLYTMATPYAAIDLPFLKYTQSANTMSLTCWNQIRPLPAGSNEEYPPYDLVRNSAADWVLSEVDFGSDIVAPTGVTATAQNPTTEDTWYSYVVTAISETGEESVASNPAPVKNNDISVNAGSNVLTWNAVPGAVSYNVYAATPVFGANPVPVGVLYGFVGESLSTNFIDTNIIADFTTVPPTHKDPFARGPVLGLTPTAPGSGYTQSGIAYTINTSTGSGAALQLVVNSSGEFVDAIMLNGGKGYAPTDTITITGDGVGATATLLIGPQVGTYPGVVAYYQQRRAYADTENNQDTYFMSQPGLFLNMDSAIPTADSDAIIGAPWAQQINGIQFMVPMPGGLVILSGSGAWQLNGGNSAALTPADQDANPQAYNGCHFYIQPIIVNYDILYVQAKGSIVRDLSYNFFVNIYTGTDTTVLSNHLFNNYQLVQWAYAEEPYKVIWCIRSDGVMLSFTYLKEQDVYAWARHDTNGLFKSVCSVTEAGSNSTQAYVDAPYLIVQRFINGKWVYYSERMDNRTWQNAEQCWCVDAGLTYPLDFPNATLQADRAAGTSNISDTNIVFGGIGYTNPTAEAVDSTGKGIGATFSVLHAGGVITAITPLTQGALYTPGATKIVINDPTGRRAVVNPIITNNANFTASDNVFTPDMVGNIIRTGGGKATISSVTSPAEVVANITQPITATLPNDPDFMPVPAIANTWSIGKPTSRVTGLNHLTGKLVSILADGSVMPQQTVASDGSITLPASYSQITVGLPFTAQLQTLYLDPQGQTDTPQGKRKDIFGVTVRMESSRGMEVGCNQPDSSTQPNQASPPWEGLFPFKERSADVKAGSAIPLFTGDEYLAATTDWNEKGQVAIQQRNPLPANVEGIITWFVMGDTSG